MVVGADEASSSSGRSCSAATSAREIEIASGIDGDETIVTTPSAALVAGTTVEPVEPAAPKP